MAFFKSRINIWRKDPDTDELWIHRWATLAHPRRALRTFGPPLLCPIYLIFTQFSAKMLPDDRLAHLSGVCAQLLEKSWIHHWVRNSTHSKIASGGNKQVILRAAGSVGYGHLKKVTKHSYQRCPYGFHVS